MKNAVKIFILCIVFYVGSLVVPQTTLAATITSSPAYAWGENIGWINFDPSGGNVTVSDTGMTGYIWSPNYGWINLDPSNGGVTNNNLGQLGGYAWSSSLGWINFSGATIDGNGKFNGIIGTNGSTVGRINFNCSSCNIVTDWRPLATPTPTPGSQNSPPSSGGGSSGGDGSNNNDSDSSNDDNTNNNNSDTTNNTNTNQSGGNNTDEGNNTNEDTNPPANENVNQTVQRQITDIFTGLTPEEKAEIIRILEGGEPFNSLTLEQQQLVNLFQGLPSSEQQKILDRFKNRPNELFDITLTLANNRISRASDLVIKILFVNLGTIPTKIQLTYNVIDSKGKIVWTQNDNITVETEEELTKKFRDLHLADGKYSFLLQAKYNNVTKELKKDFEIQSNPLERAIAENPYATALLVLLVLLMIIFGARYLKKRKEEAQTS